MSTTRAPSQCHVCKHWVSLLDRTDADAQSEEPTQVCSAFPLPAGGIPDDIWWNRADHRKSYPGDGGIQWARIEEGVEFPDWAMNIPT